jgi:AraC-like DNA-binding protein
VSKVPPLHFRIDYALRGQESVIDVRPSDIDTFETSTPLPEGFGTGRTTLARLPGGLGYARIQNRGTRDRLDLRLKYLAPGYKVTFHGCSDRVEAGVESISRRSNLNKNDSLILSPAVVGTMRVRPGIGTDDTSFFIPPDILYSVVEDMEGTLNPEMEKLLKDPGEITVIRGKATPEMQAIFEQIRNCHMHGSLRRLYLEGKVREFIALRLDQAFTTGRKPAASNSLTPAERDRVYGALDIIEHSLNNPPTIPSLARLVGLNTSKLKSGFKAQFGYTVFGYIHHLRMLRAMALLRYTDLNVSQVAWDVGYANTSAFSAAFKREFGFSPGTLR